MADQFPSILIAFIVVSLPFLLIADDDLIHDFTVDLIHRDSPSSPFYNPGEEGFERLRDAISRSANRSLNLVPDDSSVTAPQFTVPVSRGEYLMNISVGSPPFPILAFVDTRSDLIWTQCLPCENCYKQKDPLFNPKLSSTYKSLFCSSRECKTLTGTACKHDDVCQYSITYSDNARSMGDVAVDTLTIGSKGRFPWIRRPVELKNAIIGCGRKNSGISFESGSGIIGLGGGKTSLISQMGNSIGGKFSYCLVPYFSGKGKVSKINFGSSAVVSGRGTVTTPLIKKTPVTSYFLTLNGITILKKRIEFPGEGNIILDSSSLITYLPSGLYNEFEKAVAASFKEQRVEDPRKMLSLCYNLTSKLNAPTIIMNFKAADVQLDFSNIFVPVEKNIVCFAFASSNNDVGIYGSLAQMNFLVGYDIAKGKVSFKKNDCTKN